MIKHYMIIAGKEVPALTAKQACEELGRGRRWWLMAKEKGWFPNHIVVDQLGYVPAADVLAFKENSKEYKQSLKSSKKG